MSLEMKYFVLKPRSKSVIDRHATAARVAMRAYSEAIKEYDPGLADDLWKWAEKETERVELMEWEARQEDIRRKVERDL